MPNLFRAIAGAALHRPGQGKMLYPTFLVEGGFVRATLSSPVRHPLLLKIQPLVDSPTIITQTTRCWEITNGLEIDSMFWANGQRTRREAERI